MIENLPEKTKLSDIEHKATKELITFFDSLVLKYDLKAESSLELTAALFAFTRVNICNHFKISPENSIRGFKHEYDCIVKTFVDNLSANIDALNS